jgi:hypothetical protein
MTTMTKRTRTRGNEEFHVPPTDEELARMMEPDFWDEPVEVIRHDNPGLVVRLRLDRDDVHLLGAAADAAGMPLPHYLLHVAREAAKRAKKVRPAHDTSQGAA